MTYCLLLGLGLGVLAGANLMIATGGDLRGGLAGIAIGLTAGAIGDAARTLYLRRNAPASQPDGPQAWPWPTAALAASPAVIGGFVQAAGGPALVSLALLGCSIILLAALSQKQHR